MNIGDLVYIREKNPSTFYGMFTKRRGFGIITDIVNGYSYMSIYYIKILKGKEESKTFTFYKDDIAKVDLNKMTDEEYDLAMIEML